MKPPPEIIIDGWTIAVGVLTLIGLLKVCDWMGDIACAVSKWLDHRH